MTAMVTETTRPARTTNHERQRCKAIIFNYTSIVTLSAPRQNVALPNYLAGHLRNPAPGNQLQRPGDDGSNEQNVNQTAYEVEPETSAPKNKENNKDGPKHKCCSMWDFLLLIAEGPYPDAFVSPNPHLSESQDTSGELSGP